MCVVYTETRDEERELWWIINLLEMCDLFLIVSSSFMNLYSRCFNYYNIVAASYSTQRELFQVFKSWKNFMLTNATTQVNLFIINNDASYYYHTLTNMLNAKRIRYLPKNFQNFFFFFLSFTFLCYTLAVFSNGKSYELNLGWDILVELRCYMLYI